MIKANAYISKKTLCVLGIAETKLGPIPFSHREPCDAEDGAVDFGDEKLSEAVVKAITNSQDKIMKQITRDKMTLAAEDLVLRSRSGDQIATSQIVIIGQNSRGGNKRARYAGTLIKDYIKKNPVGSIGEELSVRVKSDSRIKNQLETEIDNNNEEGYSQALSTLLPSMAVHEAAVALSFGPNLTKERIKSVARLLIDNAERKAFEMGFSNWTQRGPKNDESYKLGRQIGMARVLQLVRLPKTSISILSPMAAWELGE